MLNFTQAAACASIPVSDITQPNFSSSAHLCRALLQDRTSLAVPSCSYCPVALPRCRCRSDASAVPSVSPAGSASSITSPELSHDISLPYGQICSFYALFLSSAFVPPPYYLPYFLILMGHCSTRDAKG